MRDLRQGILVNNEVPIVDRSGYEPGKISLFDGLIRTVASIQIES